MPGWIGSSSTRAGCSSVTTAWSASREIDVAEPADFVTAAASDPPPDEHVADADLVRRAMEHLDCDQRSILVLHHVQDRPIAEIAKVLGVPSGTVKWRLHAARAALQRALDEVQS